MTNLMRRDPYAVDDMFDDLMKGFFVRPMRYAAEAPRIKMDVKEDEKVIHSERFYGKVERSFSLGQDVDETGATARFDKGVLELTLPKKATTATRHLTIQ